MNSCFLTKSSSITNYTMPLEHSHSYYELYFLFQGERTIYVENDRYDMNKNDLIIIPSKLTHRTEGKSYIRYIVNFNEDFLDDVQLDVIKLIQQHKISLSHDESNNIVNIFENMLRLQDDNTKQKKHAIEHNFKVLFGYLIFSLSIVKNSPKERYVPKNNYSKRTKLIINYIQEHYSEKITLDSLSKMLFISKSVLCNEFKKNTNMSIIDYLLKTRLRRAQKRLTYSKLTIEQIANDCGFSSSKYFFFIFKKHLKVSPSEYRKKLKTF